jgi:hypothetical protein
LHSGAGISDRILADHDRNVEIAWIARRAGERVGNGTKNVAAATPENHREEGQDRKDAAHTTAPARRQVLDFTEHLEDFHFKREWPRALAAAIGNEVLL